MVGFTPDYEEECEYFKVLFDSCNNPYLQAGDKQSTLGFSLACEEKCKYFKAQFDSCNNPGLQAGDKQCKVLGL